MTPQPPPPGWYHADGDAPGTTRWWTGTEWGALADSAAQPVVYPSAAAVKNVFAPDGVAGESADFLRRVPAFLVDYSVLFVAWIVSQTLLSRAVRFPMPGQTFDDTPTVGSGLAIAAIVLWGVAIVLYLVNRVIIQGLTGQSFGKRLFGLRVVRHVGVSPQPDSTPGLARAAGRILIGFLLSVFTCGIFTAYDHLALLWNDSGRRVVDDWLGLDVVDLRGKDGA